jgi:hypothetical protein
MDTNRRIIILLKDTAFRAVDNEAVILHLESGNYYSINHVGKRMFELLQNGICDVDELIAKIASEYKVDSALVKNDIEELLNDLVREKLIEIRSDLRTAASPIK